MNHASPYGNFSTGRRKREPEGRTLDISGSSLKEGLNLSPQLLQTRFRKPQQCLRAAPAKMTNEKRYETSESEQRLQHARN